jgi:hypothetical protein
VVVLEVVVEMGDQAIGEPAVLRPRVALLLPRKRRGDHGRVHRAEVVEQARRVEEQRVGVRRAVPRLGRLHDDPRVRRQRVAVEPELEVAHVLARYRRQAAARVERHVERDALGVPRDQRRVERHLHLAAARGHVREAQALDEVLGDLGCDVVAEGDVARLRRLRAKRAPEELG